MTMRDERGVALVVALMAMALMAALGAAIIMTTTSETMIAGNFARSEEGLYAADAAIERALDDLLTVPDWNRLLNGSTQSAFVDGPPSGTRTLPDGSTIDIGQALNMANCGKTSSCSASDLTAVVNGRVWGANNPVWQAYAYGPLSSVLPTGTINSPYYVMVMVADDPSEVDGSPLADGVVVCTGGEDWTNYNPNAVPNNAPCNPGSGVISLRAEAFGPRGAHKIVELTVARTDTTNLERGYTGQRGEDEQNRRARKAAVQTPGKTLTNNSMALTAGGLR